ncbi:MAG TPA: rRNA maturation RNase YbeY [Candidatus Binataceae bacterium]|nr:rRNA maturation RNase YbeY [Candidatus Binataceae bacterium]
MELTCRTASGTAFAKALRADARTLLKILALEDCELSLMLVSDSAIRRLNREFRKKDLATDVLSFPQLAPAHARKLSSAAATAKAPPLALGDIVISIDTARRQARELDQSAAARIRTLLIHGMLHLLGYDHERSMAEARRMFAREHELAASMSNAGTARLRSHMTKSSPTAVAKIAPATDQTHSMRWSPAAMPERSAKAWKKSSARSKRVRQTGRSIERPA